jgi:hypothetical protein
MLHILTSVPAVAFSALVCRFLAIFAFNLKIGSALVMLSVPGLKALSLQIQFVHVQAIFKESAGHWLKSQGHALSSIFTANLCESSALVALFNFKKGVNGFRIYTASASVLKFWKSLTLSKLALYETLLTSANAPQSKGAYLCKLLQELFKYLLREPCIRCIHYNIQI